jgi:hypothetical protein
MRPNRKEPESAPFWFQSLKLEGRPHGGLLHKTPSSGRSGVSTRTLLG